MAKSKLGISASAKAIDPTLDALFASSAGPAQLPSRSRYSDLLPPKERKPLQQAQEAASSDNEPSGSEDATEASEEVEDDESWSEIEEDIEDGVQLSEDEDVFSEPAYVQPVAQKKERKRKRKDEYDDLEDKYMRKLVEDETENEPSEKRRKAETGHAVNGGTTEEAENSEEDEAPLVHESLLKNQEHVDVEIDKANRTLFLGNISIEAISSTKAKKLLTSHLSSPLSALDSATGPHKVESIRFRSTAYSTGAMPKRAAYITKAVMSATTKSTNAYVVYSTQVGARTALKALNGTVILDRHMRADSVAHPSPVNNRRCVFVGNLEFVDDETVLNTNSGGETTTKKRTKVPADVEEGLWRTFGQHAGKVESVRVPRDPKTRVSKGFAYVQFYDANDVESALLLDGKKFPPMLPRALRVSRAKDPRKTALAMERATKARLEIAGASDSKSKSTKHKPKVTPEQQSQVGRASRLLGRGGAARQRRELKGEGRRPRERKEGVLNGGMKTPEQIVFEGRRASATDGKPRDLKFKTKGKKVIAKGKPKGRGAKRAAEWRKKAT
ncbi:hypothetical protein F5B20DRAFT_553157 [Whalleya microplaca]|nr:hypothetical protein F5B20DRAFT_553157 [Whalleya microplaca]